MMNKLTSSSYLPLLRASSDPVAQSLKKEKFLLSKEIDVIQKETMEVFMQSIRQVNKLTFPSVPSKIHVQNYKKALHDLFTFACNVRFALVPCLMMTCVKYSPILHRKDNLSILIEIRNFLIKLQNYLRSLDYVFNTSSYQVYVQGMQYRRDNLLLFPTLVEYVVHPVVSEATHFSHIRSMLETLFDFCALSPDLYKICTTKEIERRGYRLPSPIRFTPTKAQTIAGWVPKIEQKINIFIIVEHPGFPVEDFARGWENIRAKKRSYRLIHLPTQPYITSEQAASMQQHK